MRVCVCVCVCVCAVDPLLGALEILPANITENGTTVFGPVNGTFDKTTIIQPVANTTTWCAAMMANLTAWRQLQMNTTQQSLIDLRLGDGKTTGAIVASKCCVCVCVCVCASVHLRITRTPHA